MAGKWKKILLMYVSIVLQECKGLIRSTYIYPVFACSDILLSAKGQLPFLL